MSRRWLLSAAVTAVLGGQASYGFDRTFNISLIGGFNPAGAGSNNIFSDLSVNGNVVAIGSFNTGNSNPSPGHGVWLINNTDPTAPTSYSYYNKAGQFRDILLNGNVGYFALDDSSTAGGFDVMNLTNPAAPLFVTNINTGQSNQTRNHDLFIDGHFLYIASNQNTTMKVYNITNPLAPTFAGNIITAGTATDDLHDMTIKNGRMYTSNLTNGITQVYDVSNLPLSWTTNPAPLLGQFSAGVRTHSTWPSEDGKLLAVAHEEADQTVDLWDISNLAAPVMKYSFNKTNQGIDSHSPHDPVIIGDTLYVSWYQAGLQIFNIRNPSAPTHLGAYDTIVGGDGNPNNFIGYDGNWGVYPFFGNNKILLSDMDTGLINVDATAAFRQQWTSAGANAKWQDSTKWDEGDDDPFPDSSEMTALFTSASTNRTVTIDGALTPASPRVAGIEILSSLDYTIQPTNNGGIEMKSSAGAATIKMLPPSGTALVSKITAPLLLSSDLTVTNDAGATAVPTLELGALRDTVSRVVTFNGTGNTALTAPSPSFSGSIIVNGGTLTLRDGGAVHGQTVTLSGGALALRNDVSTNFAGSVSVSTSTSLTVGNNIAGNGQVHSLSFVNIAAGSTLTLQRQNGAHFATDGIIVAGTFQVTPGGGAGAAAINLISIPSGGRLDLADSSMVFHSGDTGSLIGSAYTGISGMIQRGRDSGGWSGSGIVTTQSAALHTNFTTIAVATAADIGITTAATWAGLPVSASDTLVMYTYGGDANLDGKINIDDYVRIDNGMSTGLTGWSNGDFNYDGKVNVDDYTMVIDANIGNQNGFVFPTAGGIDGLSTVAVPEPAAFSLLALSVAGVLALRRRGALAQRRAAEDSRILPARNQ
jgi:autotransporter-associated beta strand protein